MAKKDNVKKPEPPPAPVEPPQAGECFHVHVDGPDEATAVNLRIAIQNKLTGSVRFAGSKGPICAVVISGSKKQTAAETLQGLIESGIEGWEDGYTFTLEVNDPLEDLDAEDAAGLALEEATSVQAYEDSLARATHEDSLVEAEAAKYEPIAQPAPFVPPEPEAFAEPPAVDDDATAEVTPAAIPEDAGT